MLRIHTDFVAYYRKVRNMKKYYIFRNRNRAFAVEVHGTNAETVLETYKANRGMQNWSPWKRAITFLTEGSLRVSRDKPQPYWFDVMHRHLRH